MLYSEILAVCPQIHTKHINTLCGQNVECRTYRAVNTLRLSYKNQPINAVYRHAVILRNNVAILRSATFAENT
jgi:hypothetical protein